MDENQNSGNKNTISNSQITAGGNVQIGDSNITHHHYYQPQENANKEDATASPTPEKVRQIRDLVGRNKLKEVFDQLQKMTEGDNDLHTQVIGLLKRWNALEREQRIGIISRSEASVESNKITISILELLNELQTT